MKTAIMKVFITVLLSAIAVGTQHTHYNGGDGVWYCTVINSTDCDAMSKDVRCGTDGINYRNACDLGRMHCKDSNVNQAHTGACAVMSTTTMSPQEIMHGSQVILDLQCISLSHRECVNVYNEKICGTNQMTYANFCEYEKARCNHRHLHVAHLGDC